METSNAPKIMIIRHAEKPLVKNVAPYGVDANGEQDFEALLVQGWQRAGALAVLFAPSRGALQNAALATPNFLFAAAVASHAKSERPIQTITPLSAKLKLAICEDYTKGQEADVAKAAMNQKGVVLICWQHEDIPAIVNGLPVVGGEVPQQWPGDRFDLVWVFDFDPVASQYRFSQVPQQLLVGDLATVVT